MTAYREHANRARNLPLEDVAALLGGCRSPQDKQRWDFAGCSIWIGKGEDSQRFFDHHAGRGGGGAIDLAMYVLGSDFKAALASLMALQDGTDGVHRNREEATRPIAIPPGLTPFVAPKPCPQYLPRLSEYLTRNRCLPANIVTHVLNVGLLYPDSRRNAVFLCHSPSGDVTGAELRGTGTTPFKGMAPGSRRGAGFFTLSSTTPTELVVVESALDALAYHALFPALATCIVSTAGVLPECPALLQLAEKLGVADIAVAYDNDAAGEAASERLLKSLAGDGRTVRRHLPRLKDWNDLLMVGGQVGTPPGDADQASLMMEVS